MKNLLLCSVLLAAATCSAATPLDSIPALEPVPGFIVENREITINPVPVSIRYTEGRVALSNGFAAAYRRSISVTSPDLKTL